MRYAIDIGFTDTDQEPEIESCTNAFGAHCESSGMSFFDDPPIRDMQFIVNSRCKAKTLTTRLEDLFELEYISATWEPHSFTLYLLWHRDFAEIPRYWHERLKAIT